MVPTAVRIAATLLAAIFIGRPVIHVARAARHDVRSSAALPANTADDASRMNAVAVRAIVDVSPDDATAIAQIREALQRARAEHLGVSVGGFRHSMGGQTIAPNGIVLNMLGHDRIEVRDDGKTVRVQSGAVWRDVILALDPIGRSVEVMQSDSPFSVGGSVSVNCHGWQHHHGPIASTVLAMTVVLPDGTVTRCSRAEHPELLSHVLGGYGLFGVILDADLRTVPNERYRTARTVCDVSSYERVFDAEAREKADVGMAYGRISVTPDAFLRQAIVTTLRREAGPVPSIQQHSGNGIARLIFRGSVGSDYGKSLRWTLERRLEPILERGPISRNEVLSNDIELYVDHSPDSTDILHEYFVPRGRLAAFIDRIRPILLRQHADLLNVTVRDVDADDTTALRYARGDVYAVVMFFHQERSASADGQMESLTRQLIDEALAAGGTYYLPYRLHATTAQLRRGYPMIDAFFEEKRRVDPDEIFTNQWYQRYGRAAH
jgi:FAD/FMN-containing dehydrogenase